MTRPASPLTPGPRGCPAYTQTLPCTEDSVPVARRSVRTTLVCWGLENLHDDAALIVSELASNAVVHAHRGDVPGCFRLTVERPDNRTLRLWVFDHSRNRPRAIRAPADAESGRGLAVVEALADRWGVAPRSWGKGIWAEINTAP
ncbi:ATP-binding protein [Streptomyces nojiriensis]|uniref:ATP-binding protein n=1 Tax=Streptomyces nojiriensis TaxID=66374 RepID=UPI003657F2B4